MLNSPESVRRVYSNSAADLAVFRAPRHEVVVTAAEEALGELAEAAAAQVSAHCIVDPTPTTCVYASAIGGEV